MLVHLVVRWRSARRAARDPGAPPDPFPPRQVAAVVVLGLVSAASAGLWPFITWQLTGVRSAYSLTRPPGAARARSSTSRPGGSSRRTSSTTRLYAAGALVGIVLLVLLAALGPWARPLGPELRTWSLAYPAYLGAVLEPWSSLFRYLVLLFPLAVLGAGPGPAPAGCGRWSSAVVVALFLVGQVVWVFWLVKFVPPTDYPP